MAVVLRKIKWVVGVDEVGRGCLAGPIAVAVVCMPRSFRLRAKRLGDLRDSKKLSASKREAWAGYLSERSEVLYCIARVYPRAIERVNISNAANLAAERAFCRLCRTRGIRPEECLIYLDGGLYLGKKGRISGARTMARADERIPAVMAASILAKVARDRQMAREALRYPGYGFEVNKGYGTAAHRKAVRTLGPSRIHRLTFLKNYTTILKNR